MLHQARSSWLVCFALITACSSNTPPSQPDAYVEPDAAAPCPVAALAQTLVGQHLRQRTPGDPSAGRSNCQLYRADVRFDEFDPHTCTLVGAWGWMGTDDAGVTTGGASNFICPLAGAEALACLGEDIGTAGISLVDMGFVVSEEMPLRLTMWTDTISCIDEVEPVP
ncbi:hypothetical protein [Sandaracinus amylolyticus]|uniref:Lipoprotein n=1 Tax=Sandaracinus amylolyticus TaxID=927083 RepID=A0A0F6W896_9BACT|nr:hypothetical protein [Sandaracinus amylolyticus]AKF09833.1 hypothetical protein DB32_006982 [Sandaracinus amylolyticus]